MTCLVFGRLCVGRIESSKRTGWMVLLMWKGLWDLSWSQMVRDLHLICHLKEKCLSSLLGYPFSTDSEGRISSDELSTNACSWVFPGGLPLECWQGIRAEKNLQTLLGWALGFGRDQDPWWCPWILALWNPGTLLCSWTWSLHAAQRVAAFVAFHVPRSSSSD